MPTLGGIANREGGGSAYGLTTVSIQVIPELDPSSGPGAGSCVAVSLVPDETQHPDAAATGNSTLRDFTEGQDWLVKRIVGKIHAYSVQQAPDAGQTCWQQMQLGCAFFVARANEENPNTPDLEAREYDPLGSEVVREPWIWRRTWLLNNDLGDAVGTGLVSFKGVAPISTMQYGSVLDGPHLDAKSARRVRREERLWFVASVNGFYGDVENSFDVAVTRKDSFIEVNLDYRILGAMRKSNNRSAF